MHPTLELQQAEPEQKNANAIGSIEPELIKALFNGVPGRAVFVDTNQTYRFVNEEFLEFVDMTEGDVVGRQVAEVLGNTVADAYAPHIGKLLAGETLRWEGWADYGRFGRRYVQEVVTPYKRGASVILGFVAIARDLTDLKIREQELADQVALQKATEAYYAAVIRAALDGVVVIDGDGHVVDFNPAAESIFGYDRDAVIGRPIADLIIRAEHRGRHEDGLRSYIATGVSRVLGKRMELPAMLASGETIPVELAITDVTLDGRRLFAAHIRDLRPAKRAEAEIREQRNALYQKEKLAALGSLLAGVAHELNNPLSIIIGQTMMMRETIDDTADAGLKPLGERCDRVATAADRCARIVRSFLAMARQREAERTPTRLQKIVDEALELLAYNLRSSGIQVECRLPDDMPALLLDGSQIHQVVLNLLVNAQQAFEQAGQSERRIRIGAEVDKAGGSVSLVFDDNGPGVPESIRTRIFDPFFTTKAQGVGTGIGLAVSRGLIEAHGGTLSLDEAPGGGARFTIRLPYEPALADVEITGPAPVRIRRTAAQRHVLIVDDDVAIAELLAEVSGRIGYMPTVVHSGEAAKAAVAARQGRFDAILCDIRMPSGDGPAFYDWLLAHYPALTKHIGFITGDTLGPLAGRFLANSGCPMMEKPFALGDIRSFLTKLTRPKRSEKNLA